MDILLIIILILLLLCLVAAFICFMMVFYSPKRKPLAKDEYEIPEGDIYEVFREEMIGWVKDVREREHVPMEILSHDGLRLRGRYYHYRDGAPTELLFHGYKGNAERDLSGGVFRCFALGRNALIIDQRAHGTSEGSVISFGINECRDCLGWIDHAVNYFGSDAELIITGVSMGAATVMMAAGEPLPENVKCVLADCGYTSARDIIKKVIADMHLPPSLLYPFVRLGAIIFGHFDPDSNSPIEAMKRSRVPVIFIHGEPDGFVPCSMSRQLYEACTSSKKRLVTVALAGHGLAFPVDREGYLNSLKEFEKEWRSI